MCMMLHGIHYIAFACIHVYTCTCTVMSITSATSKSSSAKIKTVFVRGAANFATSEAVHEKLFDCLGDINDLTPGPGDCKKLN